MRAASPLAIVLLAACAQPGGQIAAYQPPTGSNEVLRGAIQTAPGHDLAVGDLVFGPGAPIPRHYHPGEEFLYILGGSATLQLEGAAAVTLRPGDALRIAPGTVHGGSAGPDGLRAIASWIAVPGHPLRIPVPE